MSTQLNEGMITHNITITLRKQVLDLKEHQTKNGSLEGFVGATEHVSGLTATTSSPRMLAIAFRTTLSPQVIFFSNSPVSRLHMIAQLVE